MMPAKIYFSVIMASFILSNIHTMSVKRTSDFTIKIIHTNDMHARFEETSKFSSACTKKESIAGKCYGGFARLATLIRQARNSTTPTLFLNAGDTYQGSIWYNVHKWKIVSRFMNILAPDAICLGNHEFDDGVRGLIPFIQEAEYPIVTANLDLSQEPEFKSSKLQNSTILQVNGRKIGVIGYLTPMTQKLSKTENLIFLDEVAVIREEAKKLKARGINILIALGHSGFTVDKKIAEEVEDIDLVIGGHSNTFLYTGKKPDSEIPEGLYPTEIIQKSGRKTYVVQAYAFTKYLGNITLDFDAEGEIIRIEGNPVLVDGRIDQAKDVLAELENWRGEVDKLKAQIVGSTKVFLNGNTKICRMEECNLGNLITDAIIKYNAKEYDGTQGWTDAAIAIYNGGSIRSSISRENNEKITLSDVKEVLPFGNTVVKTTMSGEKLLEVLEFNVKNLNMQDTTDLDGGFLQVSGLQIVYDLSREYKSRVISAKVRCASCSTPVYSDLKKDGNYTILLSDYLSQGGDNYDILKDLKYSNLGITVDDILVDYLKTESPVYPGVEWRITFIHSENSNPNSAPTIHPLTTIILVFLISFFLV